MEGYRSSKAYTILQIVLPCVLFLAAREVEKRLLAFIQLKQLDKGSFGEWIALVVEGIILSVIVIAYTKKSGRNRSFSYRKGTFYLLVGAALGGMAILASRLFGLADPVPFSMPKALAICAVGPISEEVIYRGFVLDRCRYTFSTIVSIAISSFLFAVAHGSVFQMIEAFLSGLAFGIIACKTSDIRNSSLTHVAANAIIFCLSLA